MLEVAGTSEVSTSIFMIYVLLDHFARHMICASQGGRHSDTT